MKHHEWYMLTGNHEWGTCLWDISAHVRAPLSHRTTFIKCKFNDKFIKNFKTADCQSKPRLYAREVGPAWIGVKGLELRVRENILNST